MNKRDREKLIEVLRARFAEFPERHARIGWSDVESRLRTSKTALETLGEMERTGGEPDVIGRAETSGAIVFVDCSAESPMGRRSVCYDREALDSRKEHKPEGDAVSGAGSMGAELLTESRYRELQTLGEFDLKTSSWIATPSDIRALGGALFCDRRYDTVFVYHNGAQSYYAARGYRCSIEV